jgi:PadR family transcriptional regulator PadR
MSLRQELKRGSTAALILALLDERPMYGYEITKELERRSGGYFKATAGSLYPALHNLERDGLVRGTWREGEQPESGPRRRYYFITEAGRQALAQARTEWGLFAERILPLLHPREA